MKFLNNIQLPEIIPIAPQKKKEVVFFDDVVTNDWDIFSGTIFMNFTKWESICEKKKKNPLGTGSNSIDGDVVHEFFIVNDQV